MPLVLKRQPEGSKLQDTARLEYEVKTLIVPANIEDTDPKVRASYLPHPSIPWFTAMICCTFERPVSAEYLYLKRIHFNANMSWKQNTR